MKIALLGSTGFLGTVLLQKAWNACYDVKALVRNPDKLAAYKDMQGVYLTQPPFDLPSVEQKQFYQL